MAVAFRPVAREEVQAIGRLAVAPHQTAFVTAPLWTLAQAPFEPGAVLLGIWEGDTAVGLLAMIDMRAAASDAERSEMHPDAGYLWRLMVDAAHQGRGHGGAAIAEAKARAASWGFSRLTLAFKPVPGNPRPYYERHGFRLTGRLLYDGTEHEMAAAI